MQISKLYETKITCSNYNPNIDDTITVTVALVDFNGNSVSGTNATITVNQGYFTKYTRNGSDTAISGTTTKSYNGTTGTDGTFTMTYKCSEWGLATFSVNNTKVSVYSQRSYSGTRVTSLGSSGNPYTITGEVSFIKYGKQVICDFRITFKSHHDAQGEVYLCNVPSGYLPMSTYEDSSVYDSSHHIITNVVDATTSGTRHCFLFVKKVNGDWQLYAASQITSTTMNARGQFMWFTN